MRRNFSKNHRASAAYDRQKKKRSAGASIRQSYDDTYYRQKNALPAKKRSDAAEKRAPQGENKRTYDAALIAVILILVFFGLIMVSAALAPLTGQSFATALPIGRMFTCLSYALKIKFASRLHR